MFSRQPGVSLVEGFEQVNEPVKQFARYLRRRRGKDIWMMGGGEIIAAFLDAEEIDEFSLHVIPVFIGEGVPFIKEDRRTVDLKLLSAKKYADGVVHLRYEVLKGRNGAA